MDDVDLDLRLVHLLERIAQRFDRACHVGLDDQVKVGGLAFFDTREQIIEVHVRTRLLLSKTLTQRTLLS